MCGSGLASLYPSQYPMQLPVNDHHAALLFAVRVPAIHQTNEQGVTDAGKVVFYGPASFRFRLDHPLTIHDRHRLYQAKAHRAEREKHFFGCELHCLRLFSVRIFSVRLHCAIVSSHCVLVH